MSDVLGPASLSLAQTIGAFQFFLPKLTEVRKADAATNPDMVGDVRMGEIAAVATCVGIGAMVSALAKSPIPAYVAILMAGVLVCVYEATLRAEKPGNPKVGVRSTDA